MRNYSSELYIKLQKIINQSSSNDPYKAIAKALIENIDNFEHITIEKLAELSFTSISTISRFVKFLGYKNFIELKEYSKSNKLCRFMSMNDNLEDLNWKWLLHQKMVRSHLVY